jgi:hypothetical protein
MRQKKYEDRDVYKVSSMISRAETAAKYANANV